MNFLDLQLRVRALTRDLSSAIFRKVDVGSFINEGIDRIQQVLDVFDGMEYLTNDKDEPKLLPKKYHHLLAVYCSSRLFHQDEQHYQAGTLMNEFESKLDDLRMKIENGEIIITDPKTGEPILPSESAVDYVYNVYHDYRSGV